MGYTVLKYIKQIVFICIYLFGILSMLLIIIDFTKTKNKGTVVPPILENVINDASNLNGMRIENFLIRNINNDTMKLSELIDRKKFIIYNPKISCSPCFDSLSMKSFQIIKDDILIISRFYSLRDIIFFSRKNKSNIDNIYDYLIVNNDFILDSFDTSVSFICDSSLIISNVYNYDSKDKEGLYNYLSQIADFIVH